MEDLILKNCINLLEDKIGNGTITQQIYLSFKMFSFLLTHFSSTVGFLTFSGGIEIEHWAKIG